MGLGKRLLLTCLIILIRLTLTLAIETRRSGLILPGINLGNDDSRLCRTVHICHSGQTFGVSKTKVFDALKGLGSQLHLAPLTEYIQVHQHKEGCIKEECCCSSPIAVQISIPRDQTGGQAADLLNLAILAGYVENRLNGKPGGVVCMGQLQECKQSISIERRKLLSAAPEVTYETSVIPVPEMPTGITPGTIAVPESAAMRAAADRSSGINPSSGSYGENAASYGSYGSYMQQAATGDELTRPTARSLMEHPQLMQSTSPRPGGCPPCPSCKAETGSGSGSALYLQQQMALLSGSCYCRYDTAMSSWALEEAACRLALFGKCGLAGSLLECAHLEAFYTAMSHPGVEPPPHRDIISAFLFVDCPPAPPCSCAASVAASPYVEDQGSRQGGEPRHEQCCADLKVHCQVPFSGLDCADVAKFCGGTRNDADYYGAIYNYVVVKTHNTHCSEQRVIAAYTPNVTPKQPGIARMGDSIVAAAGPGLEDETAETVPLLLLRDELANGTFLSAHKSSLPAAVTIILTLMGSCLVAAVMLAGIISIVQQYGIKHCITPISDEWTAY